MKILIVSLNFHTAEGSIAKGIASYVTNHEIYFCSIAEFKYRSTEIDTLIQNVDIVHWLFNVGHLNEFKGSFFNKHLTPTIATVHHVCEPEQYKILAAEKATTIHVVSSEWKTAVKHQSVTPVHLAHLGIDPKDFKPIQTLSRNREPFKIGMIGFFPGAHNRKRIDIALAVFKKLAETQTSFEVELQGSGWDEHIPFFHNNNIKVNYSKLKRSANIFDFYGRIHALLCTSDYEGGPLPVLEALNFGIPVVSTKVGISLDALSIGGGLLANKGDIDGLVNALQTLIKDEAVYTKLKKETKAVASRFYWQSLAGEYEALYQNTINQSSSNRSSTLNINPKLQRHKELVFDKIHEGQLLVQRKQFKQAVLVFRAPLLSAFVPFSRKIDIIKYMIAGKLNRIQP